LGGLCRDYVEVFTNPGYLGGKSAGGSELAAAVYQGDIAAAAELARRARAAGMKYFRWGLANPDGLDARRAVHNLVTQIYAVRDAIGQDLELMVDLHTRLSPEEGVLFCKEVEAARMYAVEDPIRSERPDGYRRIRAQTSVPIAAGEQWSGKWEFREPIENEWIDFARADICITGGISEVRKIAALAEVHAIKMLLHNPLGPICTAASLHIDLSCDNAGPQEVLFAPDILPDVLQCDFAMQDGVRLTAPTQPGLGVTFNAEAAKNFPADMTEPPHFHRPDGSFTNY
jgi:galactonate dehydratase